MLTPEQTGKSLQHQIDSVRQVTNAYGIMVQVPGKGFLKKSTVIKLAPVRYKFTKYRLIAP